MTTLDFRYARDYEHLWSPVIRPMAEAVVPLVPLAAARRILDVGAGSGALAPALRAAAPDAEVVGVDRSLEMLRLARGRGVPAAVMDAMALGLAPRSFDAALAAFILFIVPDPVTALCEVRRVLRPHGLLATVTWGEDRYARAEEMWEEELRSAGAPARPHHPSTGRVNAPAKMERLCIDAGFRPEAAWVRTFVHRWSADEMLALKSAPGFADRLYGLSDRDRERVMERARERFASLDGDDFVWHAEVVYCVARVGALRSGAGDEVVR